MQETFEKALFDDPDDLANHAAYADWLSQEGDPRGEFIQVQLQLEDETLAPAVRKKLQKREDKLLKTHGRAWLGSLAPFLLDQQGVPEWLEPNQFQLRAGWLHSLQTSNLSVPLAQALTRVPEIRLLQHLKINSVSLGEDGDPTTFAATTALQDLPELPNLRAFTLSEPSEFYSVGDLAIITVIEKMTNLRELCLDTHRLDLKQLFRLKTLAKLEHLEITTHQPYPLAALAKSATFANLTHLMLSPMLLNFEADDSDPFISRKGVAALLKSPHIRKLTHLRLQCSDLGDPGCDLLAAWPMLRELKWLDLSRGCITDEGAQVLASASEDGSLEFLDVSYNRLTEGGTAALIEAGLDFRDSSQYDDEADERAYLYDEILE